MIKDVLWIDVTGLVKNFAGYETFLYILPFFLVFSILIALNLDGDSLSVLKRMLTGLLFIGIMGGVQIALVDYSFEAADKLKESANLKTSFFTNKQEYNSYSDYKEKLIKAHSDNQEEKSFYQKLRGYSDYVASLSSIGGLWDSFFAWGVRLIIALAFILVKIIYTSIFALNVILLPLAAAVSLVPITKNSINTPILASLWLLVMPFVVTGVLVIMDFVLAESIISNINSGGGVDFTNQLYIAGFGLLVFSTTGLTHKVISGSGLAEHLGQAALQAPQMAKMGAGLLAMGAIKPLALAGVGIKGAGMLSNLALNGAHLAAKAGSETNRGAFAKGGLAVAEKAARFVGNTTRPFAKAVNVGHGMSKGIKSMARISPQEFTGNTLANEVSSIIQTNENKDAHKISPLVKQAIAGSSSPETLRGFAKIHEKRMNKETRPNVQANMKKEIKMAKDRASELEFNRDDQRPVKPGLSKPKPSLAVKSKSPTTNRKQGRYENGRSEGESMKPRVTQNTRKR